MNWNELEEECFEASLETIKKILCEIQNERFYAFSLYTDSSAMTVSMSANSQEKLSSILDSGEDDSEETKNYYRWATSEWAYEAYNSEAFSAISQKLRTSVSRNKITEFKKELIKVLTNVLKRVKHDLGKEVQGMTFFVTITDDDDSENVEDNSAKEINDNPIFRKFIHRYG